MKTEKNIPHRHPSARPTEALFQELSATLLADEFRLLHELEGLAGLTGIDRAAVAAYVRLTMEAICLLFRRIQEEYKFTVQVQGNSSGASLGVGVVPSFTARSLFEIWVGKDASHLLFCVTGLGNPGGKMIFPGFQEKAATGESHKRAQKNEPKRNFRFNPVVNQTN